MSHNRDTTGPQDHQRNTRLGTDSKQASTPTQVQGWSWLPQVCAVSQRTLRVSLGVAGKEGGDDWQCLSWAQGRQEAAVPGLSYPMLSLPSFRLSMAVR